jgi:hypothetical protein
MAKLPNFKKIFKGDYPDESQALVEQLGDILNYNFDRLFGTLNNGVTLADNLNSMVKDLDIVVNSAGIPTIPIKLNSTLIPARPSGYMVIDHVNITNAQVYPTSGICISYTESKGVLTINHVTGLPAGYTFRLKVVFFA